MKRITLYSISFALIVAGITACGKTTKRKLVNDWKVSAYYEQQAFTSSNGDYGTNTLSMTETEVTASSSSEPSTGPGWSNSQTGSVLAHEMSIKKDGTWSSVQEISFTGGTSTSNKLIEQSGTWSFLKKNKDDDFEKNERVHFNLLKYSSLETVSLSGAVISSNTTDQTYLTGENVLVYTIKASKKDELEMELENNYAFTQTSGNNNSKSLIQKMTLKGK